MQRSIDPSRLDRFVRRHSAALAALAMIGGVPLRPLPPAAPPPRVELPRQRRSEQIERSREHG